MYTDLCISLPTSTTATAGASTFTSPCDQVDVQAFGITENVNHTRIGDCFSLSILIPLQTVFVVSVGHRSQVQHTLISCCNNALWVGRMVSIALLFLEEHLSGCLTDNVAVTGLVIQDDCGAFK